MSLDYIAIGKRIKNERKRKQMSQLQLSELSNISSNSISHIELGKTKVSLPSLVAIANALDTTVDHLLMDVIDNSLDYFRYELSDIFNECTKEEFVLLTDISKTTLETFRQIKKKTNFNS